MSIRGIKSLHGAIKILNYFFEHYEVAMAYMFCTISIEYIQEVLENENKTLIKKYFQNDMKNMDQ